MKGRSSNLCRANGGSVMRDIGGIKAPSYGTDTAVMKAAEGKTTGIVDMDGPSGGPAKPRLDRPGRKHGGSVMAKADGGPTMSKYRNEKADKDHYMGRATQGAGAVITGLGAATGDLPAIPIGLGLMAAGQGGVESGRSQRARANALDNLDRVKQGGSAAIRKDGGKVDFKKHGK